MDGVKLDPGEHVTAYAVHEDGVTTGLSPSIDMNYVIGLAPLTVPMDGNHGHRYEMDVLPAIYHKITVRDPFSIPNVYILAVFDGNTSDSAEKNNYLGYYWKRIGLLRLMTPYPLIENKENLLDKNIWFSTIRYSF